MCNIHKLYVQHTCTGFENTYACQLSQGHTRDACNLHTIVLRHITIECREHTIVRSLHTTADAGKHLYR